ncbi:endolytic transglycosylase MltG [Microbacterium awajiense]|uniref:endolytic transglycosylase MltG n=1 Tax=Microbacterium awajiense TaxID=415214 RepID=UPI0031E1825C
MTPSPAPADAATPAPLPSTAAAGTPAPMSRRAAREAAARTAAAPPPAAVTEPVGSAPVATAESASGESPFVGETGAPGPRRSRTATAATPAGPAPSTSTATLDDLFTGDSTTDDLGYEPQERSRRRRRIGGWIALGVVLLIFGGIAVGTLWVWNTYEEQIREVMGWEEPKDFEPGLANGEALVTVVSGDTGQSISQSLYEAGVTKTPEAFYDYLVDTGQNPPFVPGVFQLQQQMTSAAALEAMMDPANKLENSALVREGLTVDQTLPILADGLGLPLEDFVAATANPSDYGVEADSLEGWLFPAMYEFDPGVTAEDVIRTLVNRTVQSLDNAGVPVEDRQRVLTVASIIQREARFEEDFYKVSRVIENRLDPGNQETFGLLQMDSTAQYGYGELHEGSVSTSAEAQFDDNPWNTYVHTGLPIGPISNPGDTAIDAAMHPADGPWLYFVTVNLDTGETVFTSTLAEHERAREQWIAWCNDNPDSGC